MAEPTFRKKSLKTWSNALSSDNPEIRIRAADAIAQMDLRAASAIPQLAALVQTDPDARVRQQAARTIDGFGPAAAEAVSALTAALSDSEHDVRVVACMALGHIGPDAAPASEALSKLVEGGDAELAGAAAAALGQIGRHVVKLLAGILVHNAAEKPRVLAAHALSVIGSDAVDAVPALRAAATDASEGVRFEAVVALGSIGADAGPATPQLAAALRDPVPRIRIAAAESLAHMGPAARAALPALRDITAAAKVAPDAMLVVRCAAALWTIAGDSRSVVPTLLNAIHDEESSVRSLAVATLAAVGPRDAAVIPALVGALSDENENVRIAAMDGVRKIGKPAQLAAPRLRDLLNDKQAATRVMAGRALWSVTGVADDTVVTLLPLIRDPNWLIRDAVVSAMAEVGPPARNATDLLREALADPVEYVAADAAYALWRVSGDIDDSLTLLDRFASNTTSRDPSIRQQAITLLGDIGPAAKSAVPTIEAAASDRFPLVSKAAREAIAKIKAAGRK